MKKTFFSFCLILAVLFFNGLSAQEVYHYLNNSGIYDFLDEMATLRIIDLNSAIKPYSRMLIADKLAEAQKNAAQLNPRQQKDLDFYLEEFDIELKSGIEFRSSVNFVPLPRNLKIAYDPLGVHYKDTLFTFSVRPVYGLTYFTNEHGGEYHNYGGLEAFAYAGKWGIYASLRDNHETTILSNELFFNQRTGANYKLGEGGRVGGDYSEMRGGITYSWKWGSFGLMKDHFAWGNNYHGANIFSGHTPSFAFINLNMHPVKWFDFHYIHGWLVSEVIDTARSYTFNGNKKREIFRNKYIAANLFTFTPFRHLNFSFGNSIVYSDNNVHPAYLIPVLFYKSVDHTLNGIISNHNLLGQNSQMFFDISSRQIKHLHLFATIYLDEFTIKNVTDKDAYNFVSYKAGFNLCNYPIQNLGLIAEFTFTTPCTYQHFVPTTTFESNKYNLGHYMRDNSREIFVELYCKPVRGLRAEVSYCLAQHGDDYVYGLIEDPDKQPVMENIIWENTSLGAKVKYELINNCTLFAEFVKSDISSASPEIEKKYTPEYYYGQTDTFSLGFNLSF
jgi:hypothetical protein